ncbi:MAG: tetratricopeptide repeat protein [Muribaculaceae bacterium]|nr:tetratricopeptide repeat protein [Muribaculaceae bacterium]
MKTSFFRILILICIVAWSLGSQAQRSIDLISDTDRGQLDEAVSLMDNGKAKDAVKILDKLCKKYSNNYILEYERLYARYRAGDYKRIVKDGPKLFEHPEVEPMCYQLVGNAQDVLGNPEAALRIYDDGLKRFPNSGFLYLEKGNIHMMHKRYNEAVQCYLRGVEVQPDFASNYYRLAKLYANSTEPLWAIVYAEVVCNLQPNSERFSEMGKLIYDLYTENVKIEEESKVHVSLTKDNTVYISNDSSDVQVPFPLLYEMGTLKSHAATELLQTKKLTVAMIADLRKSALEHIDTVAPGYYNLSLLDYHRKLIKSGHWVAYNMWLMSPGANDEATQWLDTKEGEEQFEKFANWFVDNRFVPTQDEPTVMTMIYKIHALNIPSIEEISTVEGCRKHRNDALRLAKWYLEQPVNPNDVTQKEAKRFLMMWMTNTDEFTFTISENAAMTHVELMAAYMAAMTEHAIEFNVSKTDEAMYCEVMLQAIDYYKRNKEALGTIESMEKLLKMDGPTLRSTLANEYKESQNP